MLDLLRVAVHGSKQRPCGNALRATDVADGSARHEGLARPSFDRRLYVPLDIRAVDALDALRAEREYQVVRRTGMMRLAFPP